MCLRIMAPAAAHGASFEKHRGTHTRSVMYGKPLNISHEQCRLFVLLFLFHRHIVCHIVGPIKKRSLKEIKLLCMVWKVAFMLVQKINHRCLGYHRFRLSVPHVVPLSQHRCVHPGQTARRAKRCCPVLSESAPAVCCGIFE